MTAFTVDLPVLYVQEPNGTWTYLVERPSILGGPCATRAEAEEHAIVAVARALGSDDRRHDGEAWGCLRVTVGSSPSRSAARTPLAA